MTKCELLIEKLLVTLQKDKDVVNQCLIDGEYHKITDLQRRAFFTGKALRKLLKYEKLQTREITEG